jgi:DMSO/TMAO reductase YedYZ molybdopterin-dependent catalytic subunit
MTAAMMRSILLAVGACLLLAAPGVAQTPLLSLTGKVKQPAHWTMDDLRKMPVERAKVSYQTDHGPVTADFTGVLLWSLIQAAGGVDDNDKNAVVRHAIRIDARDGYTVVISTGEIAADYGSRPALVAYERDGQPLEDFRLVMPGDKHGGRNARDVISISVE